jgi:hypothetical protein
MLRNIVFFHIYLLKSIYTEQLSSCINKLRYGYADMVIEGQYYIGNLDLLVDPSSTYS